MFSHSEFIHLLPPIAICIHHCFIAISTSSQIARASPGKVLKQFIGRTETLDRGRQVFIIFNYTFLLMCLITVWWTLCLQCLKDRFSECLLGPVGFDGPRLSEASSSIVKQLMRFWLRIDLYAGKRRMELNIKSLDIKKTCSDTEFVDSLCEPLKSLSCFYSISQVWGPIHDSLWLSHSSPF